MDTPDQIEQSIEAALSEHLGEGCPPRLAEAIRYAVVPGGARIRPKLCTAVAAACGGDPGIARAAGVAIELLHCASLVHDDLPCFDDAATRRGKPSLHVAFGESLALLAGDALIVMAFQVLATGAARSPDRLVALLGIVGDAVGAPRGIVAGQAFECEARVELREYQCAKTGALFAAATMCGAASAGADALDWKRVGKRLGEAYQVADDLLDVNGDPLTIGKPVGRDAALLRPSAVRELGADGASDRLRRLVAEAVDAVPPCPGERALRTLIAAEARQFIDHALNRRAAA
jgi:geranylgeranyl diphosphate synthase type II